MGKPRFSVVVPAYNAEATLHETLVSLHSQTYPNWEAIIVDDGSTDATSAIATVWVQQDARFHLLRQTNGGESAARNTGMSAAQHDWLLLLDADDWIGPQYLERMRQRLKAEPRLDIVACGCVRVLPSGKSAAAAPAESPLGNDLFPQFVRDCPFAIHNCIVRRSLAQTIGPFDTTLVTCADWDFWQRVARTRPRFAAIPEVLAFYRVRPGSASSNAERVLLDGLTVIRRGHRPDRRVSHPDPAYANGLPLENLGAALFRHALWPASFLLSGGKDARSLLRHLSNERAPSLDPFTVGHCLFESIPLSAVAAIADWPKLWPLVSAPLNDFLVALEVQSGATGLAQQSIRHLERLILDTTTLKSSLTIGSTHGVRINIDHPIADMTLPAGVEQLVCAVEHEGREAGRIRLQACQRLISGSTIAEAIAAKLAWRVMLSHFRLNLPAGSPLKVRLSSGMQEKRPLRMASRLTALIGPVVRWQWRNGILREPQLLARLLTLILGMRPLRFALRLIRKQTDCRRDRVRTFLIDMAQKLIREDRLLTSCAVPPARNIHSTMASLPHSQSRENTS